MSARPHKIHVPDAAIDRLNQKLDLADFPEEQDDESWNGGPPIKDIKRIASYWRNEFSWRQFEEKLNSLPNYEVTIEIDGFDPLELHFIHQKSSNPNAIPLLFVHGWPGSYYEVYKLLPILTSNDSNGGPSFHVIAPSLPNFGFSSIVTKPGFGLKQYAEACHKLMLAIGYPQYATQGGDWGSTITTTMARLYPSHVRALHLNLILSAQPPLTAPLALTAFLAKYALGLHTPAERAGLRRSQATLARGWAYFDLQTTTPQTAAAALADGPVGLLAWVYEKLARWTDGYAWPDAEVCAWVSLYWFSRAGPGASVRIYHEAGTGAMPLTPGAPIPRQVKLGYGYFPKDIFVLPRAWGRRMGNVVYEKDHEVGGHFAAWEQPEALAGDLRIMFGRGGGAYGAIEGRTGFD